MFVKKNWGILKHVYKCTINLTMLQTQNFQSPSWPSK